MSTRVAINGLGRIGRAFLKQALVREGIEIVAVNDLAPVDNLAYLLKYDTAYGPSGISVSVVDGALKIEGTEAVCLSESDPAKLPWGDLNVEVVVEATGVFASYEKSKAHLDAGAKRVVISAPVKDDPEAVGVSGATVLMGVNEEVLKGCQITSNASCTTNVSSSVVAILDEAIGIEKAMLNTVHGYTTSQELVDGPHKKDVRRGRAAAQNIVPTSTGAAIAVTKAYAPLEGKFDGIALRVPVVVGSIADITFIAKKETSVEEVNAALMKAATLPRWQGVFAATEEPIVSSDIIGARVPSIADLSMTRVVGGNLVKVLSWYDNETGYAAALLQHVERIVAANQET